MQQLGYLEETILLIILTMEDRAYGFSVSEAYKSHTGKAISISAIHSVLSRLEKKGLIQSEMGGATEDRGGRRKRLFSPTNHAKEVIQEIKRSRQALWVQIPDLT